MEPISDRLEAALKGGGGTVSYPRAEVWHRTRGKTADLSLTGARVIYDLSASIPRSCDLTLAGFEAIIPDASGLGYRGTFADTDGTFGDGIFGDELNRELRGLLVPGPNSVRLYQRFLFSEPDGSTSTEDLLMGYFDIAKPTFAHTADGGVEVRVVGYDVARRLRKAGYRAPYNVAAGTNARTALVALIQSRVPGVSVTAPSTSFPVRGLTFLPVQGVDPLADAQEIAYAAGWVLSTDRRGGFTAAPPQDPGSGTVQWSSGASELLSLEVGQDDEQAVNVLVITGQTEEVLDGDGNVVTPSQPVYGSAEHTEGQWGTVELGERAVFEESEFVTSSSQAAVMAATKLPKYLGFVDRAPFTIPFAPHLDHGDLLGLDDEVLQLEDAAYLGERLEHDLAAKTTIVTPSRRLA